MQPGIRLRRGAGHDALRHETGEQARQVGRIQVQLPANVAGADIRVVSDFIQDPHLAKRPGRVEKGLPQEADFTRVEAVESPHGGNGIRQVRATLGHGGNVDS